MDRLPAWLRRGLSSSLVVLFNVGGSRSAHAQLPVQPCAELGRDTVLISGVITRAQPSSGPFVIEAPVLSRCVDRGDPRDVASSPRRVWIWPPTFEARDMLLARMGRSTELLGVVIGIFESGAFRFDPVSVDGTALPPSTIPPEELLADMPPMDGGEEPQRVEMPVLGPTASPAVSAPSGAADGDSTGNATSTGSAKGLRKEIVLAVFLAGCIGVAAVLARRRSR